VTTNHDHANETARSQELAGASHRAEAAARHADEHAHVARSVDCKCQVRAGAPCGPSGDHLARYLRAHQSCAPTNPARSPKTRWHKSSPGSM
jgi:hypothetical protein